MPRCLHRAPISNPPKPAPMTATSTESLTGSRLKSGSAHGSSPNLLNAPVTGTYCEIPSTRSRRRRSSAYLVRSASGSNGPALLLAVTAQQSTKFVGRTTPKCRRLFKRPLRHRHQACTDTSRLRCHLADQQRNCGGYGHPVSTHTRREEGAFVGGTTLLPLAVDRSRSHRSCPAVAPRRVRQRAGLCAFRAGRRPRRRPFRRVLRPPTGSGGRLGRVGGLLSDVVAPRRCRRRGALHRN